MALVKRSKLSGNAVVPARRPKAIEPPPPPAAPRTNGAKKPRASNQGRVAERLAAATEELASGLTEASAAAEELRRAMEQIASGASEAAGASQEQLQAIKQISVNLALARTEADNSRRRTEALQLTLAETALQIGTSVRAIERNGVRQGAAVQGVSELERRAEEIGEITR